MQAASPALPRAVAAVQQDGHEIQVTGLVTDSEKEPLIGVTVTVVGTQNRTVTDVDGMFHITRPNKSTTMIEFTYVG